MKGRLELKKLLTIETLRKYAKGNIDNLPTFIVHHDPTWSGDPRVDNRGRIHCSDKTFLAEVAPSWPVKLIGRRGASTVEYAFDLQPHHLEGGTGSDAPRDQREARKLVGVDPVTGKPPEWDEKMAKLKADEEPAP